MGKWFGGWDEAKGNYQAENIKTAIQAAQDAVLTRLGKDCDASSAGEPKPVSVDSSDIDWLAWL